MKIRNTILATLTLTALLSGCVKSKEQTILNNVKISTIQKDYDNNNQDISQETLDEAIASVERLDVEQTWVTKGECFRQYGPEIIDKNFGTAIIVGEDEKYQYALTAYHIYESVASLEPIEEECARKDGWINILIKEKDVRLEILTYDKELDYLLLRTKKTNKLHPFKGKIGNSNSLKQGDFIYSIGYSQGIGKILQEGIVTLTKAPKYLAGLVIIGYEDTRFMFSAAAESGCSGGPLFVSNKGKLELAGIIAKDFSNSDALNIGTKINPIIGNIRTY